MMTDKEITRILKESFITAMQSLYGWDRKRALREYVERKREE